MSDTYAPTTEDVRARMVESIAGGTISVPGGYGDLARDDAENIVDAILSELAAHDAEVAAKAVSDLANELTQPRKLWHGDGGVTVLVDERTLEHQKLGDWLRARAAEYRNAVQDG